MEGGAPRTIYGRLPRDLDSAWGPALSRTGGDAVTGAADVRQPDHATGALTSGVNNRGDRFGGSVRQPLAFHPASLQRNSTQPRRREASARVALPPRQPLKDAAAAACHPCGSLLPG